MKSIDIPTRSNFIDALRAYVGTPFRHQGRNPKFGIDCLGLIVCGLRDIGIEVKDNLNYGRRPVFKEMEAGLLEHSVIISMYDALPGDVLWIKWLRDPYPYHLAVVTKTSATNFPTNIIHADGEGPKCVTEHLIPGAWMGKISCTLRFKSWVATTP